MQAQTRCTDIEVQRIERKGFDQIVVSAIVQTFDAIAPLAARKPSTAGLELCCQKLPMRPLGFVCIVRGEL